MNRFFDIDSPFMSALGKMADLMLLNMIMIVCCLPVVTIGASVTAAHFVALKMVRNEETYIFKTFFRSFKQNFVQATVIWILQLLVAVFIIFDFLLINHSGVQFPYWVNLGLIVVVVLLLMMSFHTFPLLSKFENTVFRTIKNSALVGLVIFYKTVLEILIWSVPFLLIYFVEQAMPLILLFGFSVPTYVCAMLYNKTFKKFEPQVEEKSPDDWTVPLSDEEEEKQENADRALIDGNVDEEIDMSKADEESGNTEDI